MKKLILICDGTGQGLWDDNNMSMLAAYVKQDSTQHVYYDPGVGTIGSKSRRVFDAITGRGLWTNVLEAYTFLMENHEAGDEIYLFGYSRGAATVRILVDVLVRVGLFQKGAHNLLPYLLDGYKYIEYSDAIKHNTKSTTLQIKYVGVEDTVFGPGSIPSPDMHYLPKFIVDRVHHHIAMEEDSKLLPLYCWRDRTSNGHVIEFTLKETHTSIAYSNRSLLGFLLSSQLTLTHVGLEFIQRMNRGDGPDRSAKRPWFWRLTPKKKRESKPWFHSSYI